MSDTKPQLVLGLDIDGVLADYEGAMRKVVGAMTGADPETMPPPTHWSLVESGWPLADEAEYQKAHVMGVNNGMFAQMDMLPGAARGVWHLALAGVFIRVTTHRIGMRAGVHARAIQDTVTWLDDNAVPYREISFVADKASAMAPIYVDDAPHNVEALKAAGRTPIIFDQLYNRHLEGLRARSWSDVVHLVRQFALDNGYEWVEPSDEQIDAAMRDHYRRAAKAALAAQVVDPVALVQSQAVAEALAA